MHYILVYNAEKRGLVTHAKGYPNGFFKAEFSKLSDVMVYVLVCYFLFKINILDIKHFFVCLR